MKKYLTFTSVLLFIFLSLSLFCTFQNNHEPSEKIAGSAAENLALPSFSIFESSRMWPLLGPDMPLNIQALERDIKGIFGKGAEAAENPAGLKEKDFLYQIIPLILYKSRQLFKKNTWTEEEIQQGKEISRFLASYAGEPNLKITVNGPKDFETGLLRIRDWYIGLCSDNRTLSAMIFTTDDGPFFGNKINTDGLADLEIVSSVPIPDRNAKIVLKKDRSRKEPMIFSVITDHDDILSAVGLSVVPEGEIENVKFYKEQPVQLLKDFGYKISLLADWDYGEEFMHLYLDESLKTRFFFISW